ncbi:MAG: hypothetical protein JNK49_05975 [Planctomycetes bacterium]|nr:hypothetical protein [Planctomycetota bacterium]
MNLFANLAFAATLGLATAAALPAQSRTLILLQENSGRSALTEWMPASIRTLAEGIVDRFVETGESAKFAALAQGTYQRFVDLSDARCTRANLLTQLINQTRDGYTVDLCVLGHGAINELSLNNGPNLTGQTTRLLWDRNTGQMVNTIVPGTIRSMLSDARSLHGSTFQFRLRTVYMCNCEASSLNDDWLAIGAKVSVGARRNNYMPEPMLSDFWQHFAKGDKHVAEAAAASYASSAPIWSLLPGYTTVDPDTGLTKVQASQPVVAGDPNLIFRDECLLAVGQSRTFTVQANQIHRLPSVYLVAGQTYRFTTSGTWRNGTSVFAPAATNANGYTPGITDFARRHSSNMMCLVGERHARWNDVLSFVSGSQFRIGASNTVTVGIRGFLCLYANDLLTGYLDNVGSITVTIERIS